MPISIPVNTWVQKSTPTFVGYSGFTGTYEARGWDHIRYRHDVATGGGRMVMHDGYIDAGHPGGEIYQNMLAQYDPETNTLYLEKVFNWTTLGYGGVATSSMIMSS